MNIDAELILKRNRVIEFLNREGFDAVLISKHENIAWITAGKVDIRIGVLKETGAASLLLTKDNEAYYITTNNEAPRLANEEFNGLDWKAIVNPWYANDLIASVRQLVPNGTVATDAPVGELKPVELQSLRWELTDSEAERYRRLGSSAAQVVTDVLGRVRPGMTEKNMQVMMAEELLKHDLLPSVYLTAVDDRIRSYKHAVPRDGVLERFGMLNFCARRWGLSVSMTRFVYFGNMPAELGDKFDIVARVNAKMLAATVPGETADGLYRVAQEAYTSVGYPGGETKHHQGGAAGYLERDWVARPGGTEMCGKQQAFAWNPTLDGGKVEDTVLLCNGSIEVLTRTPELPSVETYVNGTGYHSAGVLQMD